MGSINRTFVVLSREIFFLFNESPIKPYLPSLLSFEDTRVFTLFISPKLRSMASSHHQGNEAEAPEASETFTLVVIRSIAGESQLFRDFASELVTLGSLSPSILALPVISGIEFP